MPGQFAPHEGEHDFWRGRCVDCDADDPNADGTPQHQYQVTQPHGPERSPDPEREGGIQTQAQQFAMSPHIAGPPARRTQAPRKPLKPRKTTGPEDDYEPETHLPAKTKVRATQ